MARPEAAELAGGTQAALAAGDGRCPSIGAESFTSPGSLTATNEGKPTQATLGGWRRGSL